MSDAPHDHDELDPDLIDSCDADFTVDPTPDDELDFVVLFADVDPSDVDALERRAAEWAELFPRSS